MKLAKGLIFGLMGCLCLSIVSVQSAKADIITTLLGSPVFDAANNGYDFTYNVNLTNNEELNKTAGFAQFGSIYDVGPAPVTVINLTGFLASDFTFSQALTSGPAYKTTPDDSATLYNVRYTYTGASNSPIVGPTLPPPPGGTGDVDLGNFTIVSPYANVGFTNFDGQAQKSFGAAAGTITGNVGLVESPVAAPEPATGLLLGGGLLAFGWARRNRFSKKA